MVETIRRVAALAREAGLVEEANDLESVTWQAYTTSSEMAGVLGAALRAFVSRTSGRLPAAAAPLIDEALEQIREIWPRI